MISGLIGSVLGFAGSLAKPTVDYFNKKEDNKHELAVLNAQIQLQTLKGSQELEAIVTRGNIDIASAELKASVDSVVGAYGFANRDSGVKWIEGLISSVRPVITYLFFGMWATVKIAALVLAVTALEVATAQAVLGQIVGVWDEESAVLFSAIISFWFGSRALSKRIK